jgi:RHS repeat-associated protein
MIVSFLFGVRVGAWWVDRHTITLDRTWNDLGQVASLGYPDDGAISDPARTVSFTSTNGFLTAVPSYASLINYHPNLMLNQVVHANGVTVTHGVDPNAMRRPASIATSGAATNWSTGTYLYDDAGNIKSIGTASFVYDQVSRMTSGSVVTASCGTKSQSGTAYDAFGNMTSTTTTDWGTQGFSLSSATNRLNSPVTYDAAGNLTFWGSFTYAWDRFSQLQALTGGGLNFAYLYTADGERIAERNNGTNAIVVATRDLSAKVLRLQTKSGGSWTWTKDYVYRDGLHLASIDASATKHFHLDHLGSIRRITGAGTPAAVLASHDYYPYGMEACGTTDWERMKYTGHERDLQGTTSQTDDLDYMHARYYNPNIARLLSSDLGKPDARTPQSWNRFAYVQGNPLKYVDPEGEVVCMAGLTEEQQHELLTKLNQFTGNTYGADENGNLVLISTGDNSSATATSFLNGLIGSERSYGVVATQGQNQWNDKTANVELNFNPFTGAHYGRVNPATFNLGSTLVHELFHGATGAHDEARPGVYTTGFDWTGPVVDFVNVIRAERGLPLRAAYNAQGTASGRKQRLLFQAVDPRRPE